MRSPFPLQWPEGWDRTAPAERHHCYLGRSRTLRQACEDLRWAVRYSFPAPDARPHEHTRPIITSNLELAPDALPRPGSNAADPGVAIYWDWRGREYAIACDRWRGAADNIRAVARVLTALRELGPISPVDLLGRWRSLLVSQPAARAAAGGS